MSPGTLIGIAIMFMGVLGLLVFVLIFAAGEQDEEVAGRQNPPADQLPADNGDDPLPPPPVDGNGADHDGAGDGDNNTQTALKPTDDDDDTPPRNPRDGANTFANLADADGEGSLTEVKEDQWAPGTDDQRKALAYHAEAAFTEVRGRKWEVIMHGRLAAGDRRFEILTHAPVWTWENQSTFMAMSAVEVTFTEVIFHGHLGKEIGTISRAYGNTAMLAGDRPVRFYWFTLETNGEQYKLLCIRRPSFRGRDGIGDLNCYIAVPAGKRDPLLAPEMKWLSYPFE